MTFEAYLEDWREVLPVEFNELGAGFGTIDDEAIDRRGSPAGINPDPRMNTPAMPRAPVAIDEVILRTIHGRLKPWGVDI